ncbi:MAG: winged helix DNA-binding domain-containing protein, partial [Kiritimatiellae bacterium]|nr:winged helix DNA-binding domain-containing protein [Kiritimatiellia bacterium]
MPRAGADALGGGEYLALAVASVDGAVGGAERAVHDARVPPAPAPSREEALVRLALAFFRSHGPATLADFVWWSGAGLRDCRAAVA